jgi:hypothetical protein
MAERLGREVMADDLRGRIVCNEPLDGRSCEFPARRMIAQDAGIDMQNFSL